MTVADDILARLRAAADPAKAVVLRRFFRTGKGEYGEGDVFLGITVPALRSLVKSIPPAPPVAFPEIKILLDSEFHEARMTALLLLVRHFQTAPAAAEKKAVFDFYLRNARRANNWDLVDLSSHAIVGEWLADTGTAAGEAPIPAVLRKLAASTNLWEQRIAIVSTLAFIRRQRLDATFALAENFFAHPHDLIHKAAGWMLREAGKRDRDALRLFLDERAPAMPRTMLRYAIEHFPPAERAAFLRRR
jgi:3-methyladenine DNA glycosylase AlkD